MDEHQLEELRKLTAKFIREIKDRQTRESMGKLLNAEAFYGTILQEQRDRFFKDTKTDTITT